MNHWPFIIGAYGATIAGGLIIFLSSLKAMRRAEKRADEITRRRDKDDRA